MTANFVAVTKKVLNYLAKNKSEYELVEHRPVHTAWDLASTLHVKPQQVVKTVVVRLRGKVPVLALIAAHRKLDLKKLGNIAFNEVQKVSKLKLKAKKGEEVVPKEWGFPSQELKGKSYKVDFAPEKWMKEKLLGKIGVTPAFGRLLRLPVFIDKALLKEKELFLNSGDYTTAIKMKTKDFVDLEQPLSGTFSLKK